MQIRAAGREYARFGFKGLPPNNPPTMQASFQGGPWHLLSWWEGDINDPDYNRTVADLGLTLADLAAGTAKVARLLVAGPLATDNPAGTVVLRSGRNTATIRATDTPEVVIRGGGTIDVTS